MKTKFYITTPIYYPSGKFHIGTTYTEALADAIKKYNSHEIKMKLPKVNKEKSAL